MRVAVRKRMDVRMKMRTQAVKKAWWTQTRMQRRRVKYRAQSAGVHLLDSSPGKGEFPKMLGCLLSGGLAEHQSLSAGSLQVPISPPCSLLALCLCGTMGAMLSPSLLA